MTSALILLSWLLLPAFIVSELPKTEVPLDFKHDLHRVFVQLKHVLLEPKPNKTIYGEIITTLEGLKKREEYYVTIRSFHSTKFLWERVNFLTSILRKKIYEPYSAHYSPIYWTTQETVPILVQILQILPKAVQQNKFNDQDRKEILGAANAYKLFNKARKLVDTNLTEVEDELFVAIQRLLTLGMRHIIEDPVLKKITNGDGPIPKDAEIDAGYEWPQRAVNNFLQKLTKPEKDLVTVIGGISIVSLDNRCMLFSKLGKWYLLSYPCR